MSFLATAFRTTSPRFVSSTHKVVTAPGDPSKGVVTPGALCTMHYRGTLASNGTKFDSSYDRGQPFKFTIGKGQVIKGWDSLIMGMALGEKATLHIAYPDAYGENGYPPVIPKKADLVFEVEVLGIN
ncbi:hypothetical protein CXG81DRAFT_27063 [Caulochytrium protostelioides]|uniref:peptidylprolyl isomerase n=1 Tax=Caulochytrium protostelioides TaxID=1555241 RepID=A0A4P9X523_9FUNG|nr:hypothetical protein CXG81DRAFT_27063 [Caulochytrium protostelioides]|eukprot:RKP00206.1 hypothetical protein CXG81DRAFT_27063 [Caulochytrium protostelioides]